jgi:hypothetical protein
MYMLFIHCISLRRGKYLDQVWRPSRGHFSWEILHTRKYLSSVLCSFQ